MSEKKKHLPNKARSEGMRFMAGMKSHDGKELGLVVSDVRILIDGKEEVILLQDEIQLNLNKIDGDKKKSSAALMMPIQDPSTAKIKTVNNASVSNEKGWYQVELPEKKLIIRDAEKGLFAVIKLKKQINEDFDYIDVIIGKNEHAHVTFYFDGNGKYIDQRSHKCSLEGDLRYEQESKKIYPERIKIIVDDYSSHLIMSFVYLKDNIIQLNDAKFV